MFNYARPEHEWTASIGKRERERESLSQFGYSVSSVRTYYLGTIFICFIRMEWNGIN